MSSIGALEIWRWRWLEYVFCVGYTRIFLSSPQIQLENLLCTMLPWYRGRLCTACWIINPESMSMSYLRRGTSQFRNQCGLGLGLKYNR